MNEWKDVGRMMATGVLNFFAALGIGVITSRIVVYGASQIWQITEEDQMGFRILLGLAIFYIAYRLLKKYA